MELKYCSKCQQNKPISEFYKTTNGGCKKCVQAYHREWRLNKYPPKPKPELPEGFRRCSKCKEIKPESLFYKDSNSKTGYQHKCKVCSNIARKQRNQKYLKPKEVLPDGFKKCKKCNQLYPLSEFRLSNNGVYHSPCKRCIKLYKQENQDKIRIQAKEYKTRPQVKEKSKLKKRQRYQKMLSDPIRLEKELVYRRSYRQRPEVKQRNFKHNRQYLAKPESKIKARQTTIQWRKDNPERSTHQTNIKRIRKINAKGSHTIEQWQALKSFFDCCPKCNQDLPLTRDHIIPLSKGGTDYIDNIQPLCRSCNSSKNDGFAVDYRPKLVRDWALDEMAKTY